MVYTKLCDVCGKVLSIIKRTNDLHADLYDNCKPSPQFFINRREYILCSHCGSSIERFIGDLKSRYEVLRTFKDNPDRVLGQKELGDF